MDNKNNLYGFLDDNYDKEVKNEFINILNKVLYEKLIIKYNLILPSICDCYETVIRLNEYDYVFANASMQVLFSRLKDVQIPLSVSWDSRFGMERGIKTISDINILVDWYDKSSGLLEVKYIKSFDDFINKIVINTQHYISSHKSRNILNSKTQNILSRNIDRIIRDDKRKSIMREYGQSLLDGYKSKDYIKSETDMKYTSNYTSNYNSHDTERKDFDNIILSNTSVWRIINKMIGDQALIDIKNGINERIEVANKVISDGTAFEQKILSFKDRELQSFKKSLKSYILNQGVPDLKIEDLESVLNEIIIEQVSNK